MSEKTKNVYEKLLTVQVELKAPKNQYNTFGKYPYRSCEDILEGLKPVLQSNKALVFLTDDIQQVGDRYYVKTTATFIDEETGETVVVNAYAREEETKKGMDGSQITGSASSYARKYALNGLFCIDDTKDSDYTNTHGKQEKKETNSSQKITPNQAKRIFAKANGNSELVRSVLAEYGYEKSDQISKTHYDEICKKVEERAGKESKKEQSQANNPDTTTGDKESSDIPPAIIKMASKAGMEKHDLLDFVEGQYNKPWDKLSGNEKSEVTRHLHDLGQAS